jgi:hypothetical protein
MASRFVTITDEQLFVLNEAGGFAKRIKQCVEAFSHKNRNIFYKHCKFCLQLYISGALKYKLFKKCFRYFLSFLFSCGIC